MTKPQQNGFLGAETQRIHTSDLDISIVNYHRRVSEDWHFHDNLILCLIMQGGNQESRKSKDVQALPGKIMLYNPGEVHRNRHTAHPSKNLNLEIKETFLVKNDLQSVNFDRANVKNVDMQFQLLKIYQELSLGDLYASEAVNAALLALFDSKSKDLPAASWLTQIREILSDRWDEFISLKSLSQELGVHPVTISKAFPKYFNCSLGDYMRKIKVDRALDYLGHTQKTMTEIAFDCGFSDQSHFIRVFKAYIGLTPKEFKKI